MKLNEVIAILYSTIVERNDLRFKEGKAYLNRGTYWEPIGERELTEHIVTCGKEEISILDISINAVNEVIFKLSNDASMNITFINEEIEHCINVKNGVYDFESNKLNPSEKRPNFSYVLDFNLLGNARMEDAPYFNKYVHEAFADDFDNKLRLVLEILGYAISDYNKAKTAFFFIGESNSGKSVLLEVLNRILPASVVTHVALDKLDKEFSLARLKYSKINILTELKQDSLRVTDVFKQLTACECTEAAEKYKGSTVFRMVAKSLNSSNVLPKLSEVEGMQAMLNRLTILRFNISVPEDKKDIYLVEKLYAERDVIFSLAVGQVRKLIANNFKFTETADAKSIKDNYKLVGDIIEDFLETNCVFEKEERVHLRDIIKCFAQHCEENGMKDVKVSDAQLRAAILSKPGIEKSKFRMNGSASLSGMIGIGFNEAGCEALKRCNTKALDNGKYYKSRA